MMYSTRATLATWGHFGYVAWPWAVTRLVAGRYAARGGPLRGSWRAATRLWLAGRYAAQVYHTRPKLFYETQVAAVVAAARQSNLNSKSNLQ